MSATISRVTDVTPMLSVPTVKDLIFVAVFEAMKAMAGPAQVNFECHVIFFLTASPN